MIVKKLNNYIFILILYVVLYTNSALCAPKQNKYRDYSDDEYNYSDDEFDLSYDQRQNGTANIRIVIDGVVIAVPGPESSSNTDALSLLGGLFDEILNDSNYDDDDLLSGEHLSNETNENSSRPTDKDKLPLYELEQIDKNNGTSKEKMNKTENVSSSSDESISLSSDLVEVNSKDYSKQTNVFNENKKPYGGQRRRHKFRLTNLLKPLLKQRNN